MAVRATPAMMKLRSHTKWARLRGAPPRCPRRIQNIIQPGRLATLHTTKTNPATRSMLQYCGSIISFLLCRAQVLSGSPPACASAADVLRHERWAASLAVGEVSVNQLIRVIAAELIAQPRHVLLPALFAQNPLRRAPNVSRPGAFGAQINADSEVIHVRVDDVLAVPDAGRQHRNPLAEAEQDAPVAAIADKQVRVVEDEVEVNEILNDDVVLWIRLAQLFGLAIAGGGDQQRAGVLEGFQRRHDQLARVLVVNGALLDEDHRLVLVEFLRLGEGSRDCRFVREQRADELHLWVGIAPRI